MHLSVSCRVGHVLRRASLVVISWDLAIAWLDWLSPCLVLSAVFCRVVLLVLEIIQLIDRELLGTGHFVHRVRLLLADLQATSRLVG